MARSEGDEGRTIYRLRWVGYALVIFALLNTIVILLPVQFMNPNWEFQTIGALVEQAPIPLMGLALIFFGEDFHRKALEKPILKLLSWLSLIVAIVYLLLTPLEIVNTFRLDGQANQQISAQADQQIAQLEAVEVQLNKGSPEELKTLADQLSSLGIVIENENPEQIKKQILEKIPPAKAQIQQQAQAARSQQQLTLFKNSIKWTLGSLISSVLLFIIWRSTGWAH